MSARIALATATEAWHRDEDAPALVDALAARGAQVTAAVWDDPAVDWSGFDLVVVRSTWDYTSRRREFLDWARHVESVSRLENPAAVLEWNTDKRYLADLAAAGVPVVPTTFLLAGDDTAQDRAVDPFALVGLGGTGEDVVVKPTVSAGSKDTERHPAGAVEAAAAHARSLLAAGRDVMVQPYIASVDEHGETGMVFFSGELSHGFRKGPMLRNGAADVDGLFAEEQIGPRRPRAEEIELARQVLDAIAAHTGTGPLLYARVDVLGGPGAAPVLLEAELTEPSWFLDQADGAAGRAAGAILSLLS
jgi:hypothetical protein